MNKIIILGAGGSGHDIISIINSINIINKTYEIIGFLDDNPKLYGKEFLGYKVLGEIKMLDYYTDVFFISSIANPVNRIVRQDIYNRIKTQGGRFCSLVHPSAILYDNVEIGDGVVINANCVFGTNVKIGDNVHFGYGCNIAHESIISNHCSFGAGVNLSSSNRIGSDCYIGCGVSSAHDISVCENTLIASGSSIVCDITDNNDTWIGVPVEKLRKYYKNKFKIESLKLK